jgi:hypothetical protein
VSYEFEVGGDTMWSPALQVGLIYEGFVQALERVTGRPAGWVKTAGDTEEIDVDTFTYFVDGLLDMYSRSNHTILHAQLTSVIEVSLVILERAGRPWPHDDPRLAPFRGYPEVGLRMAR